MLILNLTKEEVKVIIDTFANYNVTVNEAVDCPECANLLALYSKALHALTMAEETEEIERFVELQQAPGQYRSDFYQESDEELWNS